MGQHLADHVERVAPHLAGGREALIAVPPWYTREQLGLLLGVPGAVLAGLLLLIGMLIEIQRIRAALAPMTSAWA